MEVIADIFDIRDQQCIVNTRVEQELERDILCQNLDHSGQYLVKSAYKLLQEEKRSWIANNNNGFWKKIWNIKAPPKALNLAWRAISCCLPTKSILQTKRVQVENKCTVCNEDIESIFHSLVQCKVAAQCWKIYSPSIITYGNRDFPDWLERNLHGNSNQISAKVITLCWSIWRSRNDLVWNNKCWNPMRIVAKAWTIFHSGQQLRGEMLLHLLFTLLKQEMVLYAGQSYTLMK